MGQIPVVGFAAYSGTGKTSLIEKLVRELKSRGIRVAVVKHDGHEFEVDRQGKDSWRFTQAGADVTVVASDSHAAFLENRSMSAQDILARVQGVDLILVEGYKKECWPKILLRREGCLIPEVPKEQLLAVVCDRELPGEKAPCFSWENVMSLADFLLDWKDKVYK